MDQILSETKIRSGGKGEGGCQMLHCHQLNESAAILAYLLFVEEFIDYSLYGLVAIRKNVWFCDLWAE